MKTMNLLTLLLLSFCLFSLPGCLTEYGNEYTDKVETVKLYVSPQTGTYQPWGASQPSACMLVREEKESEYTQLSFSEIAGFTYEKGYAYELQVEKTSLAHPPADGSDRRYKLLKILSQKKAD